MVPKFLNPKNIIRKYFFVKISLKKLNGVVIYFNVPDERNKIFKVISEISRESELLLEPHEAYQLFSIARRVSKISGDMAEVGVYKGGSAKIILEADHNKKIHLFDTFQGLPKSTENDFPEQNFKVGEYMASFDSVQKYLEPYNSRITYYKGLFPETAGPIKDKKFSLVNLDVDLYQSTYDALEFFYSRMNKGGVIISHDYIKPGGVRNAIDTFFQDKPEVVFELIGTQSLIIKL